MNPTTLNIRFGDNRPFAISQTFPNSVLVSILCTSSLAVGALSFTPLRVSGYLPGRLPAPLEMPWRDRIAPMTAEIKPRLHLPIQPTRRPSASPSQSWVKPDIPLPKIAPLPIKLNNVTTHVRSPDSTSKRADLPKEPSVSLASYRPSGPVTGQGYNPRLDYTDEVRNRATADPISIEPPAPLASVPIDNGALLSDLAGAQGVIPAAVPVQGAVASGDHGEARTIPSTSNLRRSAPVASRHPKLAVADVRTPADTSPAIAQPISAPRQTEDGIAFDVSARVNGATVGRLPLLIRGGDMDQPEDVNGNFSVRLSDILALLHTKMDQKLFDSLMSSGNSQAYVTFNDLRSHGISVSFDRHDRLVLGAE